MKLTKLLALLLALMMVFTFVGCANDSDKDDDDDKKISASDLSDEELLIGKWEGEIQGVPVTMEFDGKEVTVEIMGQKETNEYEFKGKKLYVNGEEQEYEFKGSKTLILELGGEDVEFTRK